MGLTARVAIGLFALAFFTALVVLALATSAGGQGGGSTTDLFAQLNGSHEVNDQGRTGAGDNDGHGAFSGTISGGRICFGITVTGIQTPVAAHIHEAAVRRNGGVVVSLRQPRAGNPGASSGCVSARRSLLADIQRNPGDYYVNVHTRDFPDGAVRGQLFHPTSRQNR